MTLYDEVIPATAFAYYAVYMRSIAFLGNVGVAVTTPYQLHFFQFFAENFHNRKTKIHRRFFLPYWKTDLTYASLVDHTSAVICDSQMCRCEHSLIPHAAFTYIATSYICIGSDVICDVFVNVLDINKRVR